MKTTSLPFSISPASRAIRAFLAALALLCVISPAAFADILNSQEQQIANLMINDPNQGRPSLTLDPILAGVARARAMDMAKRNYFAHVNPDGVAANYLVSQAGYKLPDWWGTDRAANYIESIAAGYATAQTVWSGWMNSPDHRTHILGLNSFYAAETSYGIGYYYDAKSTYQNYWVIITAPPQPAADLTITSPASSSTVATSSVAVTGTTAASSGATQVLYRVENANGLGTFLNATGLANWSATASLAAGNNTIRVRSVNGSGTVIAEAASAVISTQLSSLTMATNGNGALTKGFVGTTSRQAGKNFTVVATPAAGYLFAGWSGDSTAATPALTFTMQDGLSFTANFIPNPFVALQGSFNGLVSSNDHPGLMSVSLLGTGAFSGSVTLDGAKYAVKGIFDASGASTVTIPRKNKTPLTAQLQLDVTGGTEQITGTISDGTFTADITTDRATFSARNPAPQAGRYTAVLAVQANTSAANVPQGSGFAIISVNAQGVASITGRLSDNTAFAQGTTISKNGDLPLFLTLTKATGSVTGMVTFRPTDVSDLDGSVMWIKPARPGTYYPQGFTEQLPVVGSHYTAPARKTRALNLTSAVTSLDEGGLAIPLTVGVMIANNNSVTMDTPGTPNLAGAISTTNGSVSATFRDPATNSKRSVLGVILQKQNAAYGYFLGVNQTGVFALGAD